MILRAGIAQATPRMLDLPGSVGSACSWIAEAGRRGVQLLAFPETWISGYPLWCDAGSLSRWGYEPARQAHARLMENSLVVPSPELDLLCRAAREAGVAVVLGANERAGHTLYNALLFIGEEGRLVAHRRKLVPTFGERLVWGHGDAAGLDAHVLAGARVGGLVCWEHWMPLPRHVLHAAGEQVHVAAWPHGKDLHQLASRHYAFEGGTYVLAAAQVLRRSDLPPDLELMSDFAGAGEELIPGGSAILAPDGSYVVEPVFGREELLVADLDLGACARAALTLDVAGHYARPDLFDVKVRRDRLVPFRSE